MLYLRKDFEQAWKGMDPFEVVKQLDGEMFRVVKSRCTLRFYMNGKSYFIKIHSGVGWKEIIKNLLNFKSPVLSAKNEWIALKKLQTLGIDTMTVCAFGLRGVNPARQTSFIITEDLINTKSLENVCSVWAHNQPSFVLKKALIEKLAIISHKMHTYGINHCDYYICHFLLDISKERNMIDKHNIKLFVIDLHRAQVRKTISHRWRVKDIAGLYFSAMDTGLTRHDIFRFLQLYLDKNLRALLCENASLLRDIKKRSKRLYLKYKKLIN